MGNFWLKIPEEIPIFEFVVGVVRNPMFRQHLIGLLGFACILIFIHKNKIDSMKNKTLFLCVPALLGTPLLGSGVFGKKPVKASPSGRPNILILLTDDQTFSTVHAWGAEKIQTPNMDRLVRNGVSFTQTHVMGGFNGAISQPSRAMLLTGRGLTDIHRNGGVIPATEKTFPEVFRENGYTTFATGKWHSDDASFNRSFSTGANIFFGGMHPYGKNNELGHKHPFLHQYDSEGKYDRTNGKWVNSSDTFSSELYADAAIEFLERAALDDKPFLMYVAFTSPHDPRNVLPDYGPKYDGAELLLPTNFLPQHPFDNGDLHERDERLLPIPRIPEQVLAERAKYFGMVSEVDVQIGCILDALEKSGRADNTIIVFTSDNGLCVGEHGLLGKQNLYEAAVRVPMVICGPGIPKNTERDAYCYLYDLYPTLCGFAGLPVPATVKGHSLEQTIRNPRVKKRDDILLMYINLQRAIKKDGYKLILYNVDGQRHPQLFDLKADPMEMTNLYDNPAYAAKRDELTALLYARMKAVGDFCDPAKPDWGYPSKLDWKQVQQVNP
ncbi:sulfatase-like hydrolase/transferase [Alistipes senegalensis]|uniref:sulfatase-like hydrolase/transferase n=1 Tax=Alistipes senegalensis TaxID=1288121 RepID=UPI001E5BB80F|nr:sulfatase-like hydrolase/transferase [Alistipes senegalensis]